ncbi:MAG: porin family protein [Endomicrobia bacterium]|nr:porin family protein [Endomicrobiia bacterium]MCL2506920.1 porin family protein [Endomicrobiia bacterium]
MKKFLAVFALICLTSTAVFAAFNQADQEFIVKAGIQPQSSVKLNNVSYDTNVGVLIGFEYFKFINNIVAFGAGASYDLPRKFKDINSTNVSFLPMFVAVKARTPISGFDNNYPFIVGRMGYAAFMNDSSFIKSSNGGMYYSLGVGVSLDYLVIEAGYSKSAFSYTTFSNLTQDGEQSAISLSVGFKFQ